MESQWEKIYRKIINTQKPVYFFQFNFNCEDSNMVKLNWDKLKTQVKNSIIEEWNGLSFIEMASPIVIPLSGFLLWMTGQSWIYFVLGLMIFSFLFAILKNKTKTDNNLQEPPVLVFQFGKNKK